MARPTSITNDNTTTDPSTARQNRTTRNFLDSTDESPDPINPFNGSRRLRRSSLPIPSYPSLTELRTIVENQDNKEE